MQLLVNGNMDLTDTIPNVNDTNQNFTIVTFQRTATNTIVSTFSNGIAITVSLSRGLLSFVATSPEEFRVTTEGLLGNFNEDPSDDFIFRDGTTLEFDASDRMIHEFGQSCTNH